MNRPTGRCYLHLCRPTKRTDEKILVDPISLSDWAATWQLSISVEKCCILNIGNITVAPLLSINHTPLPILSSNRDLGVTIAHDLSPSTHICGIVVSR